MSVIKSMISLQLDKELLAEVDKAAERRGISRSAFVRKTLERVIEGDKLRAS